LKERREGQFQHIWRLSEPVPKVAIDHRRSHLQHEMGSPLRPTHLLVLDHPLCDQRIDRGFRQTRRYPSTRPVPCSVVHNGGPIRADVGRQLLAKAVDPGGGEIAVLAQVIHIRDDAIKSGDRPVTVHSIAASKSSAIFLGLIT